MIKTIIFDIGNVLAGFTWREFMESRGFSGEKLERIARASVGNENWNEFDRGVMTDEEIVQAFVDKDPEIEADIRQCFANLKGLVSRYDYAIPWIQELQRNGYQTFYLSNFSETAAKDCAEALDFIPYMDGGILSYQDKVIKPMPEIYQLLIDRYRLVPEECVFMDDTEKNLKGAEVFGIHTILFKNREQAQAELKKLGVTV